MRRDLIIGICFSLAFQVGVAWLGSGKPAPKKAPPKDEPPAVEIVMPPPPPDDETVEDKVDDTPAEIAPPMQNDVPQVVTPTSFVQQVEPPPPENPSFDRSAIVIPPGPHMWSNGIALIDISKLDQVPVPILKVQAVYPPDLSAEGIKGQVMLEFIVDSNGNVRNAFAINSTNHEFEEAALKAIAKWKFKPGRKGGHAVNTSRVQLPYGFDQPDN